MIFLQLALLTYSVTQTWVSVVVLSATLYPCHQSRSQTACSVLNEMYYDHSLGLDVELLLLPTSNTCRLLDLWLYSLDLIYSSD